MALYLAPLAAGLGDAIVTLPLIHKSIELQETFLVARSPRQEGLLEAIEGLAGIVREPDLQTKIVLRSQDEYLNLRLHPLQTDYIWGSEAFAKAYPGYRINEILAAIAADYGYAIDVTKRTPLLFKRRPDFADKTIILPGTTARSKTWPASHWLQLIGRLEAQGHKIVMIGEPEHSLIVRELIAAGVCYEPTNILQKAINCISSSRAVVSVDTGLMHVSVQQNIPTVVIFQEYPVYLRPFPNCFPLFTQSCPTSCIKAFEDSSPNVKLDFTDYQWCHVPFENCFADAGQGCMEAISAAMVFDKVMEATATHTL
jgi:ADP-heptose:LPS heptosyltransferase